MSLSLANSHVSCLPLPFPRCGEQKNIDTHPFREAIWYYIHSIKGIRHDDYHYRKVSAHLHHHWVEMISVASLALEVPVIELLVKSGLVCTAKIRQQEHIRTGGESKSV